MPTAEGKTWARYDFLADFRGFLTGSDKVAWKLPLETIKSIREILAGVPPR